jgi:hypothetical protein
MRYFDAFENTDSVCGNLYEMLGLLYDETPGGPLCKAHLIANKYQRLAFQEIRKELAEYEPEAANPETREELIAAVEYFFRSEESIDLAYQMIDAGEPWSAIVRAVTHLESERLAQV